MQRSIQPDQLAQRDTYQKLGTRDATLTNHRVCSCLKEETIWIITLSSIVNDVIERDAQDYLAVNGYPAHPSFIVFSCLSSTGEPKSLEMPPSRADTNKLLESSI